MENNNLKINYITRWGNDGTHYNQTIKVNKDIVENFNKYVRELKEETSRKFIYDNTDMHIMSYLQEIKDITYSHLTTLSYFISFYLHNYCNTPKKDKDFERILYRNTIFEIL